MDQVPSGEQFVIAQGGTSATVVEVGGALRSLAVAGRPLLEGYPAPAICDGARGQSLLPWPNRIRDGQYRWRDQDLQLALTEPTNSCAIHGLTRWTNWRATERTPDSIVLTYRLPPQPGWLWVLDLALRYSVDSRGITVQTTATNLSDSVAPFAAGAHPYLSVGTVPVDDATWQLPAASWLPTDSQQVPTGVSSVAGTPQDFRAARQIGGSVLDFAYTDLDRDADGIFRARLTGQWTTELWMDAAYRYVEVFTGDSLPDAARRRTGLGVEPMTGPPNAFATGTDVVALAPWESWTGTWGVRLAD